MLKNFLLASSLLLAAGCTTVPITGRRQLSLVSDSEMNTLAITQYKQTLGEAKLSTNSADVAEVRRVGQRISQAVEQYFKQQGQSAQLEGYQWEFNLIDDPKTVNAWCMPGGKVAVYSGILPITKDENGLAVVMSHEISHAVAKHGAERMSDQLAAQVGGAALSTALSQNPTTTKSLFLTAVGGASQVGMLAFSRRQESEADHLGLIFMAMAGYNPEGAVPFWERMAAQSQGGTPEFLSDHPADATRIADIKSLLPEAMKYYKPR
ncbi:M48 family peptidase [Hymenobacter sp. UV11]|uniref:M48 family metallopeptidase n=1 Tax=Hymenobacter sp. UV11 TaxID=1849735 RepID=UPI00105C8007|nr:M48 family metallopeptidase [Hymenobacter sp. UV11]TDN38204.1 peptidase M48 [Hymenobacter sp. UV11]TFZ67622.1 M48 family peptidase [Hymenobacter sp. UV11]